MRDSVIKMEVNVTTLAHSIERIGSWAMESRGRYVCVANVHMCMETFDSPGYREIVNQADLVIPDGKPISIAQKLLGRKNAAQVRGQDIMNALCFISGERSLNIGLYGGSSGTVLELVRANLIARYPDLRISYAFSPPFRALSDVEDADVVSKINLGQVDILFVGLGCPKQEVWMAEHKDELHCVMLGVGAAFDFVAGSKRYAPRWVQKVGLEWLFRLCSEPRRLWKRYLKHNPRFVWYFFQQWLFRNDH